LPYRGWRRNQSNNCHNGVPPAALKKKQWLQLADIPILLLIGENEKVHSAKKAVRHLARVALNVKSEMIPGAGHDLALVKTETVT